MNKTYTDLQKMLAEIDISNHIFLLKVTTITKHHGDYRSETNIYFGRLVLDEDNTLRWYVYDKHEDALIIESSADSNELGSTYTEDPEDDFSVTSVITQCTAICSEYETKNIFALYDGNTDKTIAYGETFDEINSIANACEKLNISVLIKNC